MATEQLNPPTTDLPHDPVILETIDNPSNGHNRFLKQEEQETGSARSPIAVRVPVLSPEIQTCKEEEEKKNNGIATGEGGPNTRQSIEETHEPTDIKPIKEEETYTSIPLIDKPESPKITSGQSPQKPANNAMLVRLPTPGPAMENNRLNRLSARKSYPPQMIKLATVTVRSRMKKSQMRIYNDAKEKGKVLTWEQATNARPPLRADMEGPGPWSYTPSNKPLTERNAPAWTFGTRCYVEKEGGSRTSWQKSWFQSNDPWRHKANFHSERRWPSPPSYRKKPTMGPKQNPVIENTAPSFSMGGRTISDIGKTGSSLEPGPNEYNRQNSDALLLKTAPSFSMGSRHGGCVLWASGDSGFPGPGRYNPKRTICSLHKPAYTICGVRRSKSHILGPFSTT